MHAAGKLDISSSAADEDPSKERSLHSLPKAAAEGSTAAEQEDMSNKESRPCKVW